MSLLVGGLTLKLLLFPALKNNAMNPQLSLSEIPHREGERPRTTSTNPHTQLTQQPADRSTIDPLMEWAFSLAHIERKPSGVSVPGAVAMCLAEGHTCESCNAFMVGSEFAHFHPHPDYSLHLGLPQEEAEMVIQKGWGEWHPLSKRGFLPPNIIMLYAPRNAAEMEVAKLILTHSYRFAKGEAAKQ
ncbi:MAG: phospholipase [Bacteroidota bacterium]